MNRSTCNPLDHYYFENLQKNPQQDPPKHFRLPEGLHGGPIPEHAQGGQYAAWSNERSRIQHVTDAEGGFINFLSLSSSIYYFHVIQKKSTIFVPIYRDDPAYI